MAEGLEFLLVAVGDCEQVIANDSTIEWDAGTSFLVYPPSAKAERCVFAWPGASLPRACPAPGEAHTDTRTRRYVVRYRTGPRVPPFGWEGGTVRHNGGNLAPRNGST